MESVSSLVAVGIGDAERLSAGAQTVARSLRRPSLSPSLVSAVGIGLDAAALATGLWTAAYVAAGPDFAAGRVAVIAGLVALAAVAGIRLLGGYRLTRLRQWRLGLLVVATFAGLAALGLGSGWAFVAVSAFFLPSRMLGAALAGAALDFGLTERRAVLVGGGERGAEVIAALGATPGNDVRICGIFDDRDDGRSPPVVSGVPKLGSLDSLIAFARTAEIDMLIVTLPLSADKRIRAILKAVEVLPIDVRLSDFSDPGFRRRPGQTAPIGRGLIAVLSRPLRYHDRTLKRAVDIAGALAALAILSPVLILTAIAIRLDTPGPILFRQPRHGYNHRPVEVWKFRSMHAAACDPSARRLVTKGDPRVTRVGRFIRRTSIDELPQLFNVLTGELSLVGPRPHALAAISSRQQAFEAIVDGYAARHRVRPGITGWAQVNGWRGEIDDPDSLRQRVEHDLYYIENWSVWLDFYILAITPLRLFDTRNAY